MNISKLLRAFRGKILLETILQSAITALAAGAGGIFITSFIYHIIVRPAPMPVISAIGLGVFAVTFLLLVILGWPTLKKVARRVDALGLQERTGTMLEFQNDPSPIAQLQRQDAAAHIEKTSPRQLPIHLGKGRCMLCAVALCFAIGMMALPYDIFAAPPATVSPEVAQQEMLRQLIAQLREDAKAELLEAQTQDSLNQIIDQLEENLKNAQTDLERAAQLQEAIEKLQQQQAKQLTSRDKLGKALQQHELTRPLGEGISNNKKKQISSALAESEKSLAADTALVEQLNLAVVDALVESEVEESDLLYSAVGMLTFPLVLLDITAETYPDDLHKVFVDAETAILEALQQQASSQQQMEQMQNALQNALDQLLGNQSQRPTGEPTTPEGEESQEPPTDGQTPEGMPPSGTGGNPADPSQGTQIAMTEGFFDPISGSVSYGEVFATYYAQYLEALEKGNVPQYLQEIMDKYYSSLN